MKFSYKLVFILFGISGIFPTAGDFRNLSKYLANLLSVLIIAFQSYDMLCLLRSTSFTSLVMASAIASSVTIVHRFALGRKLRFLKQIAVRMSRLEIQNEKGFKYCWYPFVALSAGVYISLFVNSIMAPATAQQVYRVFGTTDGKSFTAAKIFYALYQMVFVCLPTKTFALYYMVVCYQIRCTIKQMSSKRGEAHLNCQELLRRYVSVKRNLEHLDSELSLFVLSHTIFTSSYVFFTVSIFLHHIYFFTACPWCFDRIAFCLNLADTVITFVLMTSAASMVSEAYGQQWERSKNWILSLDSHFIFDQLKFLMSADKNLYLTVGKFFPITRSFVVGIFGSIITYFMLFDNMIV